MLGEGVLEGCLEGKGWTSRAGAFRELKKKSGTVSKGERGGFRQGGTHKIGKDARIRGGKPLWVRGFSGTRGSFHNQEGLGDAPFLKKKKGPKASLFKKNQNGRKRESAGKGFGEKKGGEKDLVKKKRPGGGGQPMGEISRCPGRSTRKSTKAYPN